MLGCLAAEGHVNDVFCGWCGDLGRCQGRRRDAGSRCRGDARHCLIMRLCFQCTVRLLRNCVNDLFDRYLPLWVKAFTSTVLIVLFLGVFTVERLIESLRQGLRAQMSISKQHPHIAVAAE